MIRVDVSPTAQNGLRRISQVMIDKPMTARRERVGTLIGHLEDETMVEVTRSLALFLGFD